MATGPVPKFEICLCWNALELLHCDWHALCWLPLFILYRNGTNCNRLLLSFHQTCPRQYNLDSTKYHTSQVAIGQNTSKKKSSHAYIQIPPKERGRGFRNGNLTCHTEIDLNAKDIIFSFMYNVFSPMASYN